MGEPCQAALVPPRRLGDPGLPQVLGVAPCRPNPAVAATGCTAPHAPDLAHGQGALVGVCSPGLGQTLGLCDGACLGMVVITADDQRAFLEDAHQGLFAPKARFLEQVDLCLFFLFLVAIFTVIFVIVITDITGIAITLVTAAASEIPEPLDNQGRVFRDRQGA